MCDGEHDGDDDDDDDNNGLGCGREQADLNEAAGVHSMLYKKTAARWISTGGRFMWTILRSLCMMSWRPLTAGHQSTRPQPAALFAPQFPVCLSVHILAASIGIPGSGLVCLQSVCQVASQELRHLLYAMQGNMHIVDDGPSRSRWRTAGAAHAEHWTCLRIHRRNLNEGHDLQHAGWKVG